MARILVTGGAGFLGSRVVALLGQRGDTAVVPRRRDYDLTDARAAERIFDETHPDTVIHLAAEVGGIGANQANPGRYFYANLAMGLNVLEQSRLHEVSKIVVVGTVCAYPKYTPTPFREGTLWDGYPEETNAPYGVAKRALLTGLQAYRAQYGLNGVYLLPANLYGPGDNFDLASSHVVPALVRKFTAALEETKLWQDGSVTAHDEVELWGDGSASREFLYVDDAADAIVAAHDRYDKPAPVNLGTGCEITIAELAEQVARLAGFTGRIRWDGSMPNGQPRRCLDTQAAEREFGWRASTPLQVGLERTVAWWKEHRKELLRA